ncbi:MAG: sensor histidine kinase, partial [Porcipelethomonas sp.]
VTQNATEHILRESVEHASSLIGYDTELTVPEEVENIQDSQEVDIVIYDNNGNCLYGQNPYIGTDTELSDGTLKTVKTDGKSLIVYDIKSEINGNVLWVRGIDTYGSAEIAGHSMLNIGLILIPSALILAAVGGYFITRKAFAPIDRITETVNQIITANDLDKRVSADKYNDDELGRLARTFDEMLSRLQAAFSMEQRFTSDASHELRNPVAAIISQCEYLQSVTNDAEQNQAVDSIYHSAKRMSDLISSLLMLTRADSNRLKMSYENFDFGELVEMTAEEFEQQMYEKSIVLNMDISQNVTVFADQTLIIQLLINLFSNAVKYSRNGGIIDVAVRQSEQENMAVFSISDNGIGIKAENLNEIWNRFYREDNARKKGIDGYGLGLPVAKWIAEVHGGVIEVSSKEGEGSVFTVMLPMKAD